MYTIFICFVFRVYKQKLEKKSELEFIRKINIISRFFPLPKTLVKF